MPWLIKNLRLRGGLVRDYYKYKKTYIPREGGMVLLFACGLMITLFPMIIYATRQFFNLFDITIVNNPLFEDFNYIVVLVILMFGLFGMFDDYVDVGRPLKVILPMVFIIPIIFTLDPTELWLPFRGKIDLYNYLIEPMTYRGFYRFMIIPIYIIVVSNLTNMHSGFNGLQSGLSSIILVSILLKASYETSTMGGTTQDLIAIGGLTGAIVALWFFNKYPAQIFEGNTGSLMIGAGIGLAIIIRGYHFTGFIMLIPHTINFLMYVYWRIQHKLKPEDARYKLVKFGRILKNGTLKVPNQLTLKWYLPYKFKMTEKQAVYVMYLLTIIFCILGFLVPEFTYN
jgi:UDP-N-acetylglucosamine--dolichyl-phosphate N-acetylglucosaminephosphotransferase